MNESISNEEMNSTHNELEQAQLLLVQKKGTLPPFVNEPWTPVARRTASDKDVDEIIEQAEEELEMIKKPTSKMQQARDIFNKNKQLSRKKLIDLFVETIGISRAAASTYYQTIKRNTK